MTLDHLRELSAHHDQEAAVLERQALSYETTSLVYDSHLDATAAELRARAQWHRNTAIQLREFADAITQAFELQPSSHE